MVAFQRRHPADQDTEMLAPRMKARQVIQANFAYA
ncbi:hypothetical protein X739_16110 [Mesorhizobium sp. LNHC220B00]|nr:hypothetical protein X739_16110 [Mesorhizobium sp. LNHC220B00]